MVVIWEQMPPVSEDHPVSGAAACEFAGYLYLFGGASHDHTRAPSHEMRHAVFDCAAGAWLPPEELDVDGDVPTPRIGCTATRLRGTVYLFGGQQTWPAATLNDLYAASVVQQGVVEWQQLLDATPCVPTPNFTPLEIAAAKNTAREKADKLRDNETGDSLDPSNPKYLAVWQQEYDKFLEEIKYNPQRGSLSIAPPAGKKGKGRLAPQVQEERPPSRAGDGRRPGHRAWHAACSIEMMAEGDMCGASAVVVCGGASPGAKRGNAGLMDDLWLYLPDTGEWKERSFRPGGHGRRRSQTSGGLGSFDGA